MAQSLGKIAFLLIAFGVCLYVREAAYGRPDLIEATLIGFGTVLVAALSMRWFARGNHGYGSKS